MIVDKNSRGGKRARYAFCGILSALGAACPVMAQDGSGNVDLRLEWKPDARIPTHVRAQGQGGVGDAIAQGTTSWQRQVGRRQSAPGKPHTVGASLSFGGNYYPLEFRIPRDRSKVAYDVSARLMACNQNSVAALEAAAHGISDPLDAPGVILTGRLLYDQCLASSAPPSRRSKVSEIMADLVCAISSSSGDFDASGVLTPVRSAMSPAQISALDACGQQGVKTFLTDARNGYRALRNKGDRSLALIALRELAEMAGTDELGPLLDEIGFDLSVERTSFVNSVLTEYRAEGQAGSTDFGARFGQLLELEQLAATSDLQSAFASAGFDPVQERALIAAPLMAELQGALFAAQDPRSIDFASVSRKQVLLDQLVGTAAAVDGASVLAAASLSATDVSALQSQKNVQLDWIKALDRAESVQRGGVD
ncbi:MAG: hypothetical protein KJZ64_06180 [Sphingomonadaceae bacterium]|nr:hypothetical protein [Sphingomonadaceae bacterium]